MTIAQIKTIAFTSQQQAQALFVSPQTPAQAIIASLEIPQPRALLILNGGTAKLEGATLTHLQRILQNGLARVVAEEGITVITGGTDAGIFALFGQGRAKWGGRAPCIGVAVADLVTWPGKDQGEAPLEPHHSHFVLVQGKSWGDETATLYRLADELSKDCPSVALFAGGGEIATRELQANVAQGRPLILLAGSGRATDGVLAARAGATVADQRFAEIGRFAGITAFGVEKQPHLLRRLVRRMLFGTGTTGKPA